jgi:hypothetical protein
MDARQQVMAKVHIAYKLPTFCGVDFLAVLLVSVNKSSSSSSSNNELVGLALDLLQ